MKYRKFKELNENDLNILDSLLSIPDPCHHCKKDILNCMAKKKLCHDKEEYNLLHLAKDENRLGKSYEQCRKLLDLTNQVLDLRDQMNEIIYKEFEKEYVPKTFMSLEKMVIDHVSPHKTTYWNPITHFNYDWDENDDDEDEEY